jgi:hypothetical protein
MKLIDKDALLAEIEKLESRFQNSSDEDYADGYHYSLKLVKRILDTFEVKGVDFEKYYHEFLQKEWFGNSHVRTVSEMMAFTAKHFFELGLKAQKGEEEV